MSQTYVVACAAFLADVFFFFFFVTGAFANAPLAALPAQMRRCSPSASEVSTGCERDSPTTWQPPLVNEKSLPGGALLSSAAAQGSGRRIRPPGLPHGGTACRVLHNGGQPSGSRVSPPGGAIFLGPSPSGAARQNEARRSECSTCSHGQLERRPLGLRIVVGVRRARLDFGPASPRLLGRGHDGVCVGPARFPARHCCRLSGGNECV